MRRTLISAAEIAAKEAEKKRLEDEKEAELKRLRDAQALEEDEQSARRMNISLQAYRRARDKSFDAVVSCQSRAIAMAKYNGASRTPIPNFFWSTTDGIIIHITGHDVTMKNGFNAERTVRYTCDFDITTGDAVLLSID